MNTDNPQNKPDYSLDAPAAIKQLSFSSLISILMGILIYVFAHKSYPIISIIILVFTFSYAILCLVFVTLMFRSSKIGKLRMRDKVLDSLNLNGDEKILDIGCGRGLLLISASKRLNKGGKAVGIDLWRNEDLANNSKELTQKNAELEKVSDRIEIVSGDMSKMDFPNNYFDVGVSSMAIHNVPTKAGRNDAIREIARVLKPGGKLLIVDFQNAKDYQKALIDLGWKEVNLSRKSFMMFPPVRIVQGIKPNP